MPLAVFEDRIPLAEIVIDRKNRQRREITKESVEELAFSIKERGLLNPVIIRRDNKTLLAGERRFTAYSLLNSQFPEGLWASIPFRYYDALDEAEAQIVELEENLHRQDLSWQDTSLAVHRIHSIHESRADNGSWTVAKTGESLGLSEATISRYLTVARELVVNNSEVSTAATLREALNKIRRITDRAVDNAINNILAGPAIRPQPSPQVSTSQQAEKAPAVGKIEVKAEAPTAPTPRETPILNADFLEWAEAYTGEPFNFLHCDFPYGVDHQKSAQGNVQSYGAYDDREEVYWKLLDGLKKHKKKLLYPSCHMVFWFSMTFYAETMAYFEENFPEFVIEPFPLIWHKDRSIAPDVERRPRRVYETALFGFSNNRKTIKLKGNLFQCGAGAKVHASEKPLPMLRHFMEMVVDKETRMLDPTCGSGTSVRAAKSLDAGHVLGIEKDPEFARIAQQQWDLAEVLGHLTVEPEKFNEQ